MHPNHLLLHAQLLYWSLHPDPGSCFYLTLLTLWAGNRDCSYVLRKKRKTVIDRRTRAGQPRRHLAQIQVGAECELKRVPDGILLQAAPQWWLGSIKMNKRAVFQTSGLKLPCSPSLLEGDSHLLGCSIGRNWLARHIVPRKKKAFCSWHIQHLKSWETKLTDVQGPESEGLSSNRAQPLYILFPFY